MTEVYFETPVFPYNRENGMPALFGESSLDFHTTFSKVIEPIIASKQEDSDSLKYKKLLDILPDLDTIVYHDIQAIIEKINYINSITYDSQSDTYDEITIISLDKSARNYYYYLKTFLSYLKEEGFFAKKLCNAQF